MLRAIRTCTPLLLLLGLATGLGAQSLYDPSSFRPLTADHRAYRVGDGLTVLVYENASAKANADTSSQRTHDAGVSVAGVTESPSYGGRLQTSNGFDGQAQTRRSGNLLAQITVTVTRVEDNGDLRVSGKQLIEINNERQEIFLEGRVRPQDLGNGNTVLSTRLADARISYVGMGELATRQRPGWWSTLLSWLGL